jgi:hypothetical protein
MPRFYFHVHESHDAIDKEGIDLPDLHSGYAEGMAGLRGIISEQVRNGLLLTCTSVKITDNQGECLAFITFMDAMEMLPLVVAHAR